ncbi:alpha-2,8-polysialyltransferase family protein [Streptomyces sp. NBC_00249]|uniref:polysialyltransferase family glycosyltransferase n=1 Tax=Streptomyces sp. NBC_00249 TaxID=2975690 RepID=UPI0022500C3B|nr:polysialyltransferase family glycosyltransferase [Streptomyces sp. NBC_00249]MCX5193749.1 alpha-2,8-polysialyltransferase family protein [Streptomyces sp. NBC_00249]
MTRIFAASTLYGAMTVAAAIDAGQLGHDDRERVLLVCNNVDIPEVATPLHQMPGAAAVLARFHRVVYWNELIYPFHPALWSPRDEDAPLWRSVMAEKMGLRPGPLELVLESIQVKPAQTLCKIFSDATLAVYADGLMSYGPTRNDLHRSIHGRITQVLYLDLVPTLLPMLLTEYGIPSQPVHTGAVLKLLAEVTEECRPLLDRVLPPELARRGPETAVLLGQYLSPLGILTEEEEEELHLRMFQNALRLGFTSVVFKPHPSAPSSLADALGEAAREAGVAFLVLDLPVLAEAVFVHLAPRQVIGCFSTGLFTARTLYGIPVAQIGALEVIRRMRPYANSNRIPATLTHALLPDLEEPTSAPDDRVQDIEHIRREVTPYVQAVGYCMQPKRYPFLREVAEGYVAAAVDGWEGRPELSMHFNERTRTRLDLPGPRTWKWRKGKGWTLLGAKDRDEDDVPFTDVSLSGFASLVEAKDDHGVLEVGARLLAEQENLDLLIGMAQAHIRRKETDQAKRRLQRAVEISGSSGRALVWLRIGETAAKLGKPGDELRRQAGRNALRINPASPAAQRLVKAGRFGRR